MPIANTKYVQCLVQCFNNCAAIVSEARDNLDSDKSNYDTENPSLDGSCLSSQNLSDMESWISDLGTLADDAIVDTIQAKDAPSQSRDLLS